jgi:hypothetical protein
MTESFWTESFLKKDVGHGELENPSNGQSLRAFDSKPPHGFSPCGHGANSACPNHLQAFGGFVKKSSESEQEETEWANWRDLRAAHWPISHFFGAEFRRN